jgi:hypothetical protein
MIRTVGVSLLGAIAIAAGAAAAVRRHPFRLPRPRPGHVGVDPAVT